MKHFTHASLSRCAAVAALWLVIGAGPVTAQKIVEHPDKLKFEELVFQPPTPQEFRHVLKCGARAYVGESHEVPTFELTVMVRTGSMYEPVEKAGLADMTAYVMRNGGIQGVTAQQLDERIAFLAGDISVSIGTSSGSATLFCLSKDIDEGLKLLEGVIRYPTFDSTVLDRYRADILTNLKQRNSETSDIESREWQFLIYGNHPCTTPLRKTDKSVNSITRNDLMAFHKQYFFPKNFIFAAAGDFKTDEILAKLDKMVEGWADQELKLPPIPYQIPDPKPGVYMIKKEDVNQTRIRIGHIGVKRDIPDEYALSVMNDVLGGGGFISRIMRRVRSDEGLAYDAGSAFPRPVDYPGTFYGYFQTKHATAAYGSKIILDEIKKIRTEKCESEIVENSKAGFISMLVNPFSNKINTVRTFASDDYTKRPDDYWQNYTANYKAVTPDAVLAAAQKYLHPEKLAYLMIGDPDAIQAGWDKDPVRPADLGSVTILPLRDPVTLEVK